MSTPEPLATSIRNGAAMLGVSRAFLYKEIKRGHLRIVKAGTRSLLTFEEIKRYLASRPASTSIRAWAFGTLFGLAGLLGGDAAVDPGSFAEDPCPILKKSPLTWLQRSGRGCVVLDPLLAAPVLHQASGPFPCVEEEQARWLVNSDAVAISKLLVPAEGVPCLRGTGCQGLVPPAEVL